MDLTQQYKKRTLFEQVRRVFARPQFWFGMLVLVPWLVWYSIFEYRPILMGLWMSSLKYNLLNPDKSPFIGLANFINVFTYDRFWIALKNTFVYSLASYLISMPIALVISWCIFLVKRGRGFYQFVIFIPVVISAVAVAMVGRMLFDPQTGIINQILLSIGLPAGLWVQSSDTSLLTLIIVDVWKGLGFSIVLLSTAMLNIPESLYDAAKVDGVNGWQMLVQITIPLITNTIVMVSILNVMGGLQTYVFPVILGPGPGTSTLVINQIIINEAFNTWRFGFAAAISLIMFVIILVFTLIQMRFQSRWEY
jgi:ABC-type sugar transport system permease subunit